MDLLLSDVEISEGTTEITETTFRNHRLISSIKIPDSVLVIGERAFADCVNLKTIELPDSIMAIGKYAFANCINLESLSIPPNIKTIEEGVFEDCASLQSVSLSDSISAIKDRAFANCTGIKQLELPDNLISCAATSFPNSPKYLSINKNYKYENGMMINTANSMLLFYSGEKKDITVPAEVKGIAFRAFYDTHMQSVRIPEGVISISEEAFANCGEHVKVVLPESMEFIENSAFDSKVDILCKKGSYAENWCRHNPDYHQLLDEEF